MRTKLWQLRNPAKVQAHIEVSKALARGDLVRASVCSRCDNPGPTVAHHVNGYAREHWFDVHWVCPSCHWHLHHLNGEPLHPQMTPATAEELALLAIRRRRGRPRKSKI